MRSHVTPPDVCGTLEARFASTSEMARHKLARLAERACQRRVIQQVASGTSTRSGVQQGSDREKPHGAQRRGAEPVGARVWRRRPMWLAVGSATVCAAIASFVVQTRVVRRAVDSGDATSAEMPRGTHADPPTILPAWLHMAPPSSEGRVGLEPAKPIASDPPLSPSPPQTMVATPTPLRSRRPPRVHPDLDEMSDHFTSKPVDTR
jgi:hypothetical protein